MAQNSNARTAPASPSIATSIGSTGLRGRVTGVTRFGSRAGLIVAGVLGMVVLAIVYGVSTSGSHRAAATAMAPVPQILTTTGPLFEGIPGADKTPAPASPRQTAQRAANSGRQHAAKPAVQLLQTAQAIPVLPDQTVGPALTRTRDVPDIRPVSNSAAQASTLAMAPPTPSAAAMLKALREQQAQLAAQAAQQAAEAGRHAAILVSTGAAGASPASAAAAPVGVAASTAAAQASPEVSADPATASQRAKNEFLSLQKSTTANDYLTAPRQASISPYEVQAGSIIPAILVTGINSDLPGQMIGQVSQNVYDSKTGQYLLIPAGSKLVGRYDSQVVNGQSRVLVAWQRIIFPDSSFIDINGMAGADTAGYTGFTGKVDDHSGKLFRNAILFSLIGAGTALLQPRTAIALTPVGAMIQTPSVASQVAGQVGTQVGQVAQQAAGQGVAQQPTIEVRPGYLFNILVDRDLVLPGPYAK